MHVKQWIATLHPENADVSIDHRFLIPGNPWWTIYEHIKTDLPSATAVPIHEEDEYIDRKAPDMSERPHWLCLCSPIDGLVGAILVLVAFLGVLICEIQAFTFYFVAFIFYWIAKTFDPPNAITGIFYSLFMALYYGFALGDSVSLLCSVIVTEILAAAGWLVSFLFGGIWMANHRHQYIRRACHFVRWGFRAPFSEPPRHFSTWCLSHHRVVELPEPTIDAEVVQQTNDVVQDDKPGAYHVQSEAVVCKFSDYL